METYQSSKLKRSIREDITFLPPDFKPGVNHVIIGRGKRCYAHEGNKKLRLIVHARLKEYSTAPSKSEKSQMLSSIITAFREGFPAGGFIKQDLITNVWFDVGDFIAKEKISQTFRDVFKEKCRRNKSKEKDFKKHSIHLRALQEKSSQMLSKFESPPTMIDALNIELFGGITASPIDMPTFDEPFKPSQISELRERSQNMLMNVKQDFAIVKANSALTSQNQKNLELLQELEDIELIMPGEDAQFHLSKCSANVKNTTNRVNEDEDYWELFMLKDSKIEAHKELDDFDFTMSEGN